ncbi:MAG: HD-GYP domain-containing protein [Bacillota bacterium]|nr:HD-GYP domain-containing protein [Bacillota bacterium]
MLERYLYLLIAGYEKLLTRYYKDPSQMHFISQVIYYFLIVICLVAITTFVYYTGGTKNVYPHFYYLVIVAAAIKNGPGHGIVVGIAAALLAGPFMPQDVALEVMQPTKGWLIRLGFFSTTGLLAGSGSFLVSQRNKDLLGKVVELKQLNQQVVAAFVKAVDAKDVYTASHSHNVAEISRLIGTKLNMQEQELEELYMGAILHDIGKIGVPDYILGKPGFLEESEMEAIKKHPIFGARILMGVPQYRHVIETVQHHHERFDGRGYPDGKNKAGIPLHARIVAVADAWDAMTSKRPYRKALSKEEALHELKICSGTQFDPEITDVFVAILEEDKAGKLLS